MQTAVIYARYSSDSQTEQSIEGQLRVCQQYAKNNDILIVGQYIDRAMTGTNDNRPDFQRMIKDSSKGQWNLILVYKLDRFSRNQYEMAIHKKTLTDNGVKIVSAMENIPDSPEGIILRSLLEGMAEYYSKELSQKVLRGLNESYIKGNFTGGNQIYGYDVVDKKNVINNEEAEIVKEVFSKFANGFTGVDIAKSLKDRGIRNKKGKLFNDKKIYKMIENTKYVGKVKHRDTVYTNIYPPIINEQTWQRVQSIRNSNKHAPGRKKDILNYILSGKLVCGCCKTMMVGESCNSKSGKRHYYYNCLSRRRRHIDCNFKTIRKKFLEDKVLNITFNLLSNNDQIKAIAKAVLKQHENVNKKESNVKSLENKRDSLLKASNNLISAIEQGIITEQTKIRLKELETQIAQIDFEIEQEKQRTYSFLTEEKIISYLNSMIYGNIEDIDVRKEIVKTFIREIVMFNNQAIITYNFFEPAPTKKHIRDDIDEIMQQSRKTAVLKNNQTSYKSTSIPPMTCKP